MSMREEWCAQRMRVGRVTRPKAPEHRRGEAQGYPAALRSIQMRNNLKNRLSHSADRMTINLRHEKPPSQAWQPQGVFRR